MTHHIRRGTAAVALASLVVLGGVAAAGGAAAETTGGPAYGAGWLELTTGASNAVTYDDGQGNESTQTLRSGKNCALSTSSSLLAFGAEGGIGVGLRSGSIGVREGDSANGVSCGEVDTSTGEVLFLGLGSAFSPTGSTPLVASSASLDIDLKQNASITATAYLRGVPVGSFELQSGSTIDPADADDPLVHQCNNPADSGPDANTLDNCRWPISVPSWLGADDGIAFDTLRLAPDTGSFSLEGGADGIVGTLPSYLTAGASVVELVEGVVDCDEEVLLKKSAAVPSSTWKRLDNVDGSACAPYPYATSTGSDAIGPYAHLAKPLDVQLAGQAVWSTTFVYKGSVPTLLFVFDQPGTAFEDIPLSAFAPLEACTGKVTYDGTSVTFVNGWAPPQDTDGSYLNYACLLSTTTASAKNVKTVTFTVYVVGDAGMRY